MKRNEATIYEFTRLIVLATAMTAALARPTAAAPVPGADVTYTLDADFDQGTLLSVNHDPPNPNQLQLSKPASPLPFVNIAASGRGTVERVDANTGDILGEYLTAPDQMGRNPSRTTVDQHGNVWVANRDEGSVSGGEPKGSVARIGLISGGTRSDADGSPNPSGDYLKPPFAYNTCVDRDGDGLIRTSRGLDHVFPWPNTGGADTNGGVSTAADECILNYTRVTGTATRTVAVDPNNDVWVGGYGDLDHEKVSGVTGLPIPGTQFNLGCGGYGGLLDGAGVLWSARGNGLLRYDTGTMTGACLDGTHGDYGLGIDPDTGEIWHTFYDLDRVAKLAPDGSVLAVYSHGFYYAQGVAVDGSGNVWVAHSLNGDSVGHLRTDGTYVGNVPVGSGPTGVAVDANGKVWVANLNSSSAMRIDPSAGPTGGGGFPVGAVDLTVDLGSGAGPYNYSDMTGFVAIGSTSPQGTWTVVQDSGAIARRWDTIVWNIEPQASEPAGTTITVDARAADSETALSGQTYVAVGNGVPFSLTGRYIGVRVTLKTANTAVSPVLSDARVRTNCGNGAPDAGEACDDGDSDDCNACHNDCTVNLNLCGDGHLCLPETCDDGNTTGGDCCSATCTFESTTTSCEADGNLCTNDRCDGAGRCVFFEGVTCQPASGCEGGEACQAASGCVALPDPDAGTPCDLDSDLCTVDQCDGAGTCAFVGQDPNACVDHHLCYRSTATTIFATSSVNLADDFDTVVAQVKKPVALCLPASVNFGAINDAVTHELSYRMTPDVKHVRHTGISVTDQIGGSLTLDTLKGDRLLVPTSKDLGGDPAPPLPGVADHYRCYKVKVTKGTPKLPTGLQAWAADQFENRLYDLRKPSRLCMPVDTNGEGIPYPAGHLMCYRVKAATGQPAHTRVIGLIHTANEFGVGQLDTLKEEELCVRASIVP